MTSPEWEPDETTNPCDAPDVANDRYERAGSPRDTSRASKMLADQYERRNPYQGRRAGGRR
jgi:hypothetical protein